MIHESNLLITLLVNYHAMMKLKNIKQMELELY